MQADEAVAASSAAAVVEPVAVESLTGDAYLNWQKTGELPAKESPKKGDSAAPEPGKAAADDEAAAKKAESGTAKKDKKPDQERNWRQLEADRDAAKNRAEALEKEVADLKAKAEKPAAGATEEKSEKTTASLAESTKEPQSPERPKRPRFADFTQVTDYEAAMDKYDEAMLEYPAKKAAFERAKAEFDRNRADQTARQKDVVDSWKEISTKGNELYGKEAWAKVVENQLPIYEHEPVERYLRDLHKEGQTDAAAHLCNYFSVKRSDLERIIKLPAKQQFLELAALETAMREELKLESGEKKPDSKEQEPPKKEVTAAKPPPREVGARSTTTDDPSTAALKSRDVAGYMAAENAKEVAARKAGRK